MGTLDCRRRPSNPDLRSTLRPLPNQVACLEKFVNQKEDRDPDRAPKALADVLEALVAAVYLDTGTWLSPSAAT